MLASEAGRRLSTGGPEVIPPTTSIVRPYKKFACVAHALVIKKKKKCRIGRRNTKYYVISLQIVGQIITPKKC